MGVAVGVGVGVGVGVAVGVAVAVGGRRGWVGVAVGLGRPLRPFPSRLRGLPPPGPRFGLNGLVLKRRTG
ncbi:hypothetical protein GCM10010228_44550 [Streptomyces massasporeus]|nr:hypothetical protein GCM10010228_44550 [Streptomyces massasporeus]